MEHYRQIAVFAKTVELGSFRRAAEALNLSPSVVSHHISQLEHRLGVTLLYRSTRNMSLTWEGEQLLVSAKVMVDAVESGLQALSQNVEDPGGELRITVPAILAHSKLVDYISEFSSTYPKMTLSLDFSDQQHDVILEGIDVAIRMGWLKDSALRARKLFTVKRSIVASEEYLKNFPEVTDPKQLEKADWLELVPVANPILKGPDKSIEIKVKSNSRIKVNDAHALYQLVKTGLGMAVVPDFIIHEDVSNNIVSRILPEWPVEDVGVYAVWPSSQQRDGLKTRFVSFLAKKRELI